MDLNTSLAAALLNTLTINNSVSIGMTEPFVVISQHLTSDAIAINPVAHFDIVFPFSYGSFLMEMLGNTTIVQTALTRIPAHIPTRSFRPGVCLKRLLTTDQVPPSLVGVVCGIKKFTWKITGLWRPVCVSRSTSQRSYYISSISWVRIFGMDFINLNLSSTFRGSIWVRLF